MTRWHALVLEALSESYDWYSIRCPTHHQVWQLTTQGTVLARLIEGKTRACIAITEPADSSSELLMVVV